jgi:hypothetical protein
VHFRVARSILYPTFQAKSFSTPSKPPVPGDSLSKTPKLDPSSVIANDDEYDGYSDYDDVGPFKNPITGEIGGPKGPEPTRYAWRLIIS